jgi:hypothetical protein
VLKSTRISSPIVLRIANRNVHVLNILRNQETSGGPLHRPMLYCRMIAWERGIR